MRRSYLIWLAATHKICGQRPTVQSSLHILRNIKSHKVQKLAGSLLLVPEQLTRQVSLAFVSACITGTGVTASSPPTIRISQTFTVPSDEAEATRSGGNSLSSSSRLAPKIATPLIRFVWALGTDQACFPDRQSQALTMASSPPVTSKLSWRHTQMTQYHCKIHFW